MNIKLEKIEYYFSSIEQFLSEKFKNKLESFERNPSISRFIEYVRWFIMAVALAATIFECTHIFYDTLIQVYSAFKHHIFHNFSFFSFMKSSFLGDDKKTENSSTFYETLKTIWGILEFIIWIKAMKDCFNRKGFHQNNRYVFLYDFISAFSIPFFLFLEMLRPHPNVKFIDNKNGEKILDIIDRPFFPSIWEFLLILDAIIQIIEMIWNIV